MKKLKVILPAILTLAVSTSAAVTGTVAWFTATRLRTVQMAAITAVNPESGLELTSVVKVQNTKVEGVDNTNKPTYEEGFELGPKVTHAWNVKQGYFRDASVDVQNGKVFKGLLDREGTGEIAGYDEITDSYGIPEALTYNDSPVIYADSFNMTFTVTNGDPNYNTGLFLDLANSTVSLPKIDSVAKDPTANDAPKDAQLYRALRFGFKSSAKKSVDNDLWFVWAPFGTAEITSSKYVKAEAGTIETPAEEEDLTAAQQAYAVTNFVRGVGSADEGAGNLDKAARTKSLADDTPMENDYATSYIGYLGNIKAKAAAEATPITITCYTWFEGLDAACVNANFSTALTEGLKSDLKFVSRKFKAGA